MTKPGITLTDIKMGSGTLDNPSTHKSNPMDPFHALIMSNFSGVHASNNPLKVHQVDRDNYDELLAKLQPQLKLNINNNPLAINITELEDFEPDSLYQNLEIFSQLRRLRRRLLNQTTFAEAAREISDWQHPGSTKQTEVEIQNTDKSFEGNLLDATLSETATRAHSRVSDEDLAQNLIRDIIAPHILPKADPKQAELIETIDKSTSDLMSKILHHPQFQALEGAWRGLYSLIKQTKTSSDLKLFILNIEKNELAKLVDNDDVTQTSFYKKIVEPYTSVSGAKPWSIWFGDYTITDNAVDIFFLERMGKLAQLANITFVSSAASQLVSCQSLAMTPDSNDWKLDRDNTMIEAWRHIRASSQSRHLALTFPRVLARLPYGKHNRPIDNFSYEEMPESKHDDYLWINAGYALLIMLAESYSLNKWQFKPGEIHELSGLPAHVYDHDGEKEIKPCAEILLTEKGAERIKNQGIIPVWSVKQQDKIRIGPMISFHVNPQLIYGNWVN